MNTTYLSMNTSAQSNINSPYIVSGLAGFSNFSSAGTLWCNDFVVRGSYTTSGAVVFSSTLSVAGATNLDSTVSVGGAATLTGAVTTASTLSVSGKITATSGISVAPGKLLDIASGHTHADFISFQTTASATSVLLTDGSLGIFNVSTTSCVLYFRSGNTSYNFRCDVASVL